MKHLATTNTAQKNALLTLIDKIMKTKEEKKEEKKLANLKKVKVKYDKWNHIVIQDDLTNLNTFTSQVQSYEFITLPSGFKITTEHLKEVKKYLID